MLLKFLVWARDHNPLVKKLFFAALLVLVGINCFILPHHPHFYPEKYPGFWAGFGLICALCFVIVLKKVIFPIIGKSEDFYDRD